LFFDRQNKDKRGKNEIEKKWMKKSLFLKSGSDSGNVYRTIRF